MRHFLFLLLPATAHTLTASKNGHGIPYGLVDLFAVARLQQFR